MKVLKNYNEIEVTVQLFLITKLQMLEADLRKEFLPDFNAGIGYYATLLKQYK